MLRIMSISLGSSKRDKVSEVIIDGQSIHIERKGTDGDKALAKELFHRYDGLVDAFGMGGTDLYLFADEQAYAFEDSFALIKDVKKTPVLDGSGLKRSLEPYIIKRLVQEGKFDFANKKVLHMCGVDRYALGKALVEQGARVTFGDLVYGVGINVPIHSLTALRRLAQLVVPILTKLPINWFYPTGEEQNTKVIRHPEYFLQNDIIVGDFLFIKKFMPDFLPGKYIITNTVTVQDREMLAASGIKMLLTVTPNFDGRSFGTNVLEAMLIALAGRKQALTTTEYEQMLYRFDIKPDITYFENKEQL